MRPVIRVLLLVAAIGCVSAALPSTAAAQTSITGRDIRLMCKAYETRGTNSTDGAFCIGHIGGFVSGWVYSAAAANVDKRKQTFCLPYGVTVGQFVSVFIKYLDDHPERWHEAAHLLMVESFGASFPCPSR